MISSTSISSTILNKESKQNDEYTPIPHFPACLGGEWKNIVKTPYLKTTMKFKAGTTMVRIESMPQFVESLTFLIL